MARPHLSQAALYEATPGGGATVSVAVAMVTAGAIMG